VKLFQVAYPHERTISWFSSVHCRNYLEGHSDNCRCPSIVFNLQSKITQNTLCNVVAILMKNFVKYVNNKPIPVAALSKAWVYDRSLVGGCGFESRQGYEWMSFVSVVCFQVELTATGWSPVQRSLIECCEYECDREASTIRMPWPTVGCCSTVQNADN
jgi:hypothetical protein